MSEIASGNGKKKNKLISTTNCHEILNDNSKTYIRQQSESKRLCNVEGARQLSRQLKGGNKKTALRVFQVEGA